jgi:hypothetical protein
MLGIVEEQHPDRARLFMQWKQMGWPILVDSLNLLEVTAVPLTFAIDEHGVIRKARLRPEDTAELEEVLAADYEAPATLPEPPAPGAGEAATASDAGSWRRRAVERFLWGGREGLDDAIAAFAEALRLEPDDAATRFRLGVARRARYDSEAPQPDDFAAAGEAWQAALEGDPNQYLWRRRIQQYGPRLAKPYPFYDWVEEARVAIRARGGEPAPLRVEPSGAELAGPAGTFEARPDDANPDPDGRVHRDPGKLIRVESAVLPPRVTPGESVRAHLTFRPRPEARAHWNNEVDPLLVWPAPPPRIRVGAGQLTAPLPPRAVSEEPRRVEFELHIPEDAEPGPVEVPAYALYYVCEDVDGTCLYRRQDLTLSLEVVAAEE